MGIIFWLQGIWYALWFAGFLLAESNINSESLFMLLLSAALSYYLSSLYKHLFYFQARVKQSVIFLLLSTFSSYYGAKPQTSHTSFPGDSWINVPSWVPRNTRLACTLGTSRTNSSLSCHECLGPHPNLDSKPPHPESRTQCGARTSTTSSSHQSVRKRAGSTTREQQAFPAPIPKFVLGTIICDLPRVICNDRSLIDTDREKV